MKLDTNVAKWAVNVLQISRTRRHLDRATLMVFWEKLDRFDIILCSIFVQVVAPDATPPMRALISLVSTADVFK